MSRELTRNDLVTSSEGKNQPTSRRRICAHERQLSTYRRLRSLEWASCRQRERKTTNVTAIRKKDARDESDVKNKQSTRVTSVIGKLPEKNTSKIGAEFLLLTKIRVKN